MNDTQFDPMTHESPCCYACIGDREDGFWYHDEYRDPNGNAVCCCRALSEDELAQYAKSTE